MPINPIVEEFKEVKINKIELYDHLADQFTIPANWAFESFTYDEDSTFFLIRYKVAP